MNPFFEVVLGLTPTILLVTAVFFCIRFYLVLKKYLLVKTKYYEKKIEGLERK